MPTAGLPNYKRVSKKDEQKGKAERARRKECHGNWYACDVAHPGEVR